MKTKAFPAQFKAEIKTIIVLFLLFFSAYNVDAQFLNRMARHAESKAKQEADNRAKRRVDKQIDKGFDAVEDAIDGKNKKQQNTEQQNPGNTENGNLSTGNNTAQQSKPDNNTTRGQQEKPEVVWSKFDFVPGDEVIFEDGPSASEENGEFPSKWDLKDGNAEIAEVDGEKVVIFPHGGAIVPFLKNAKEDYLPEVFTVEFDVYFQPENPHRLFYSFFDDKNQRNVGSRIYIYSKSISYDESSAKYSKSLSDEEWRHFSIAVTKDKLKVYLNDERLINIPHMGFNPTGITLEMNGYAADKVHQYVKNVRIAKGGVKYYDRVLSDGKIIVNGIRFDVNKATIKPESNGAINEIFQLMQKQTDLNFCVEGHTDSDGDEIKNQALSESRAKAVMERLISLGISSNRLKSAGWGESKPIGENGTPEGKANNRRVEFVKF